MSPAAIASDADIQKAYRELARKHHPDMNPDKPGSVKKFQEIQAAFDILNNPEKREKYDRYGSSFETMGEGTPQNPSWGAGPGGGFSAEDIDFGQFFGERFGEGGTGPGDIFSHFRRAAGRNSNGTNAKRRGGDATAEVTIPFGTAVSGGELQFSLHRPSGETETMVVKIPPGMKNRKKMRLRGKGEPASGRRVAGDLMLTVHVAPHPFFPARVTIFTSACRLRWARPWQGQPSTCRASGTVSLHVPPGTSSGKKLRVKGHGVAPKGGPWATCWPRCSSCFPPI